VTSYPYDRDDRERAEGRPAIIARVRSLLVAADMVNSQSLEAHYRNGARRLMARHGITESELIEENVS